MPTFRASRATLQRFRASLVAVKHETNLGDDRRVTLSKLLDAAIVSEPRPLYNFLARQSNLPGARPNIIVQEGFAQMCASLGARVDPLLRKMATIDADFAPGGSEFEFVPMCAVTAIGMRGTGGDAKERAAAIDLLHQCADDLRWRVRADVASALMRIGAVHGEELVREFEKWTDGYFHASAVLKSLTNKQFLSRCTSAAEVCSRLDESFKLAENAPRAAARYPGYKALLEDLASAPAIVAQHFGVPVFDEIERWAATKHPVLREVVEKNVASKQLQGRYSEELDRVQRALNASKPARRDPTTYVGPTRGRGRAKRGE